MEGILNSLITWMQTFNVQAPHKTASDLSDGVAMAQALSQISPDFFEPSWLSKIKPASSDNWRLKASNLKKVLKSVIDFHMEVLEQQITEFKMPDIFAIAEKQDPDQLARLLQLILGCAVNCDRKHEYIEIIMGLEEDVQHVVMNAIQELIMTEVASPSTSDSFLDLNDQMKRVNHELRMANEAKEQITSRCHELDLQVAILQEEKSTFVLENDKLLERLGHLESFEDPSTVAGRRFQQMQHKLDMLQDEVYKLETARDEFKTKVDIQQRELFDFQQKNEEFQKEVEETRILKDELDVLRHKSDKVEVYETTIETYKKKLVDHNDMKRQIKLLEEKNAANVKHNVELEEELKKSSSLKNQMDAFKKQCQELHAKLSEEIRRADKCEFESKRLSEKFATLQKEKERLVAERDSMKETIDELKYMQIHKESEVMQGNGSKRASGSLSDGDMLDVLSPEIKEKLIRLQHENKMLKLKESSNEDQHVALLQSLLDESKSRQNELETENRLANQRIFELQGNIQDLQENESTATSQEGAQLRKQLNIISRKLSESEAESERKKETVERLEETLEAIGQKNISLQETLKRKDEELKVADERYKKYLEKAKSAMFTIDPQQNPDIAALKNQLLEKDKLLATLERETQKNAATREMESQLITSAFYSMNAHLQRKASNERLLQMSPTPQTFLSRQRQATSKRLNMPGVATRLWKR